MPDGLSLVSMPATSGLAVNWVLGYQGANLPLMNHMQSEPQISLDINLQFTLCRDYIPFRFITLRSSPGVHSFDERTI